MDRLTTYFLLLTVVSSSIIGCDGATLPEEDAVYNLQLVSGDNQTVEQGAETPEPIVLRVVDEAFRPQSEVELRTLITTGDGEITSPNLVTDGQGLVHIRWKLGQAYAQSVKVWTLDQPSAAVTVSATTRHKYLVPAETSDGWRIRSIGARNAAVDLLSQGVDAIRKGTYPEVHSLLVVHQGDLVFEVYFPGHDSNGQLIPWDRDTPHEVQSASKSFRSMLVGIAIDRGFIESVDVPIAEFFPEYASLLEDKQSVTLEHILTMSSGIEWTEGRVPYGDPRNTLSTMYTMPFTRWTEYVLSQPMAHEPGTVWFYNTGASIMLNRIVIGATQMNLGNFVSEFYSDLVESATLPGVGAPLGANTLPRDMAKFGQVFLDEGRWKGTQIVSEEWIQQSFRQAFQTGGATGYGYQWWNRTLRTSKGAYKTYYAGGNGGQYVMVIRDLNLVVVATGGNFGLSIMSQMFPYVESWVIPAFE